MNNTLLKDLDVLILECRNSQSREYIKEAVNCYRVGAFRASIIMCWIAVACDYMDKLKELELTGDAEAKSQLEYFRSIQEDKNPDNRKKRQQFENKILDDAKNKFEFITISEFKELERLKEDRNRCAHLSVSAEENLFKPSAELARFHITSAFFNFIKNPPAQGKNALELIDNLLNSQLFPSAPEKVITAIKNSPLGNGRDSLVKSFIIISLKGLYVNKDFPESYRRALKALPLCSGRIRVIYLDTIKNVLSNIFGQISDEDLWFFLNDISQLDNAWEFLKDHDRNRIKQYIEVELLKSDQYHYIEDYLMYPPLKESAEKGITRLSRKQIYDLLMFCSLDVKNNVIDDPRKFILYRAIDLYTESTSFEESKLLGPMLFYFIPMFSFDELEIFLKNCEANSQVYNENFWIRTLSLKVKQHLKERGE